MARRRKNVEMFQPVRLEQWNVGSNDDGYTPPELQRLHLRGEVFGDPKREDGSRIRTSAIESAHGSVVTTESGSRYFLGAPHPEYVKWCTEHGKTIDPENPIKVIGSKRPA